MAVVNVVNYLIQIIKNINAMISTKYRKEQKKKAKEIIAAKRASKDPTKKDKIKGNKKDHKVRMARRNEKLRQKWLFKVAERNRQIEKLKAIIEENKRKKLEEESGVVQEGGQNEIGQVYENLLNQPITHQKSPDEDDEHYEELFPSVRHLGDEDNAI